MKTQKTGIATAPLTDQNINYNILIESPSQTRTPLQMVCFFDFDKNQHYQGGTDAVNKHFNGEIDSLRRKGIFKGNFLETLLITPKQSQIPAQKLLLVGLGDPSGLSFERLEQVGYNAVLEALKLGVDSFCFAPSLKDAGLSMPDGLDISTALPRGMSRAVATARMLSEKNLGEELTLREIFLLASEPQAAHAYKGLSKAFEKNKLNKYLIEKPMAIKNFNEVQAFITRVMEENKKKDAPPPRSPHKAFWMSMSYSEFTQGNVPGVLDPATQEGIPILEKGNSAKSNIILALKGEGPLFDPVRGAFGRMPAGDQTPFTPEEIIELSNWIDNGCPEF